MWGEEEEERETRAGAGEGKEGEEEAVAAPELHSNPQYLRGRSEAVAFDFSLDHLLAPQVQRCRWREIYVFCLSHLYYTVICRKSM